MQLDLDVTGRRVVIFGRWAAVRRAVRRYAAAGAQVTVVITDTVPPREDRPDWVRCAAWPDGDDDSALLGLLGPAWMAITVGLSSDARARVAQACAQLRVLQTDEPPAAERGSVTLVGGGPGAGDLLTVRACAALRDADVVFFDRLSPSDDLAALAPTAELVDVGKSPYHHAVPQNRIEDLIVARAQRGDAVVRLKGGDSFVFGRGGEEMLACAAAGVPVTVVPGVSSSIAVPAAAGIPVTHRGLSHAFTVISGHVPPSEGELAALVELGGTVVILMGVANLQQICAGLTRNGLPGDTPAAVVERGYSESQRTTITTLGDLPADVRRLDVTSPAVVVVGAVARLGARVAEAFQLAAAHQVGSA